MSEQALDSNLKYPWQPAVLSALIEYHPERMRDKIVAAERAIIARINERPMNVDEVLALRDAWLNLKTLFPRGDPQTEQDG